MVRTTDPRYTEVAMKRSGANMDWSCDMGPIKNMEEPIEQNCPNEYNIANFSGRPRNIADTKNVDSNDRSMPTPKQMAKPHNR